MSVATAEVPADMETAGSGIKEKQEQPVPPQTTLASSGEGEPKVPVSVAESLPQSTGINGPTSTTGTHPAVDVVEIKDRTQQGSPSSSPNAPPPSDVNSDPNIKNRNQGEKEFFQNMAAEQKKQKMAELAKLTPEQRERRLAEEREAEEHDKAKSRHYARLGNQFKPAATGTRGGRAGGRGGRRGR